MRGEVSRTHTSQTQLRGYRRLSLAKDVLVQGASSVFYKVIGSTPLDILKKSSDAVVPNKQVLRQAASNLKKEDKFAANLAEDILLTKGAMEVCDETSQILKGFVRVADIATQQYIFHSEDQLAAFHQANTRVLHLDATGSLIKKDKKYKTILLLQCDLPRP